MEERSPQNKKRFILLLAGLIDSLLGGAVLLLYFEILPFDLSSLGIPRWVIGLVGGLWFLTGFVVLLFQLTKSQSDE